MTLKKIRQLNQSDHWASEFYSSILLISIGIYGFVIDNNVLLQRSFTEGYLRILPEHFWQIIFILLGVTQLYSLKINSNLMRGISAFFASSLLFWGALNILIYGYFHISMIAWLLFSFVDLYALYRILLLSIKKKISNEISRNI